MNKLLLALTLIAAFFTSNAIAEKINYYGHEYSGDLKDGKPHGEGEIINNNGSTFVGAWKEDKWFMERIHSPTVTNILVNLRGVIFMDKVHLLGLVGTNMWVIESMVKGILRGHLPGQMVINMWVIGTKVKDIGMEL